MWRNASAARARPRTVPVMASSEVPGREFRQMRHDIDDVYGLLDGVDKSIVTSSATQGRHGNRLEEVQQSLDLQSGRLDRIEDVERKQGERLGRIEGIQQAQGERLDEILTLLRGRSG